MKASRDVLDNIDRARAEGRVSEGPHARVPPPVLIDIPHGVSEAEFQKSVIAMAQAHGWKVAHLRKVRVQRANGHSFWETPVAADGKGFPDLVMVNRNGGVGRLIVAELKVGRNETTPEQRDWLTGFMSCMAPGSRIGVFVWRPEDWRDIVKHLTGTAPEAPGFDLEALRLADDGNPHAAAD